MSEQKFSPAFQKLVETTIANLHYIARSEEIQSVEQAVSIKQNVTIPLGVLNSRYKLQSNASKSVRRREK